MLHLFIELLGWLTFGILIIAAGFFTLFAIIAALTFGYGDGKDLK